MEEDEDVGSIEVCLMGDRESAESYTVVTMNQPSGDNPATGKEIAYWLAGQVVSVERLE